MTFQKGRTGVAAGLLFLIMAAALAGVGMGTFCYLNLGLVRLVCPVGYLELCLANRMVHWGLLPAFAIVLGLIGLVGRAFCSWICPATLVIDQSERILDKVLPQRLNERRKRFKRDFISRCPKLDYRDGVAILVGAGISVAVFGYPFVSTFCPIGVITRNAISLVRYQDLSGDLLFVILAVWVGYLFSAGWKGCCPAGMLRGVAATGNRLFYPVLDYDQCNQCGTCERVCPEHFCLYNGKYEVKMCYKCFECIDCCPKKAISLSFIGSRKRLQRQVHDGKPT